MNQPRIIKRIKNALGIPLPTAGTTWASIPRSNIDLRSIGNGRNSSVVSAPLAWIIRNWTESKLVITTTDSDNLTTPLPNHALAAKLRNPNAEYSGTTLQKATIADYKTTGNAYWLIALDRQNRVAEIWWAPQTTMTPEAIKNQDSSASQTRQTDYYTYTPGNGRTFKISPLGYVVPGTEPGLAVLHFRDGINPDNPLKGISPLASVLREVYTDDEASTYTASLLKNMGVPGIIVSPTESAGALPPPAAEDVKETKRAFLQATTGVHRGEPIIMTGPTKLDTFGYDPSQMNLAELRRIPEERVCGALGVQPAACGLGAVLEQAKFANMQQAREASWEEGILPTQRDIAETIALRLLPLYEQNPEQFDVMFDVSMVRALSEDQDKIAERAVRLLNGGVVTLAEARSMIGVEVDDDQNVYRLPLSLVDVPADFDDSLDDDINEPDEPDDMNEPDEPDESFSNATDNSAKSVATKTAQSSLNNQQRAVFQILQRQGRALESPFADKLETLFRTLGKDAVVAWRDAGGSTVTGVPKKEDPSGFGARLEQIILSTLAALKLDDWAENQLGGLIRRHYTTVASELYEGIAGVGITIGNPDPVQARVLQLGGTRYRLVNIQEQTELAIRAAIKQGIDETLGPVAIERRIRELVENGPNTRVSYRAMRIARTETLHAQRVSALAFYQESNLYETVLVSDNNLGYNDEDCMARDGLEVSMATALSMIDEEHPNGTLAFLPGTLA